MYFNEKIISKNMTLVRDENDELYIKKVISPESVGIYEKLKTADNENIVKIYEILQNETDEISVIEEYVDGMSLYEVSLKRKFTADEVRLYITKLCGGVEALHGIGIIHRDLTYNNIMLSRFGEIKIVDFDISRTVKKGGKTDTTVLGTPGFAAPEQYGFMQSDEKTDIYAIGSVLDFMLKSIRQGEDINGLLYIADKCMKFNPDERYKSIKELMDALDISKSSSPSRSTGKVLRWAYYILVLIVMLPTVFNKIEPRSFYLAFEIFAVEIFPVMLYGNEFDWQKKFPSVKYAKRSVRIIVLTAVYILVLFCVIMMEAFRFAIGG